MEARTLQQRSAEAWHECEEESAKKIFKSPSAITIPQAHTYIKQREWDALK